MLGDFTYLKDMRLLLIISFLLYYQFGSGQTCGILDIPIDGGLGDPAPIGWECLELGCGVLPQYPTLDGGGVAVVGNIPATPSWGTLAYTIDNLIPGNTYLYAVEARKPNHPAIRPDSYLHITVADYDEIIEMTHSFEIIYICFEARGETEQILFQIDEMSDHDAVWFDRIPCGLIDVDAAGCDFSSEYEIEIEDDYFEVCPEEEIRLDVPLTREGFCPQTPESFWWECSPPEGLDFLSDPSVGDPTFLLPDSERFNYDQFVYTVHVQFENCLGVGEITVNMLPSIIPEFEDVRLCEHMVLEDIPTRSDDGYMGYWEGEESFEGCASEFKTFTFHIDPGQNNCLRQWDYTFFIEPTVEPEFELDTDFCTSNTDTIEYPLISLNAIEGEWTMEEFSPALLGEGTFVNEFFPDPEIFPCAIPTFVEINISPSPQISFNLENVFCLNDNFVFPILDMQGIGGSWTISGIDTISSDGTYTNVFTPNIQICDETYVHEFRVIDLQPEVQSTHPTACGTDDGIISIMMGDNMEFSIDSGTTWQIENEFLNLGSGDYLIQYRSIPDALCSDTLNVTLSSVDAPVIENLIISEIVDCQNPVAEVSISASGQEDIEYSLDGLNWQLDNTFDLLTSGFYTLTIRYILHPECIVTTSFEIDGINQSEVENIIVNDISDCGLDDGSIEIISSDTEVEYSLDGIEWQTDASFNSLSADDYTLYFRPVGTENCENTETFQIVEPELPPITTDIIPPSNCGVNDGAVIFDYDGSIRLEFSIDGMPWTSVDRIRDLGSGSYVILYRLAASPNCLDQIEVTLQDPDVPIVQDVVVNDDDSCLTDNGRLEIIVDRSDVEYSIDNGLTWQSENYFEGLPAGNYTINIRPINDVNCVAYEEVEIEDPDLPRIDDILIRGISSCVIDNGMVEVVTFDAGVEFSLDGQNWQTESLFEGLGEGMYVVSIRKVDNLDCVSEEMFMIEGIEPLEIQLDLVMDPTCEENDGSFTISYDQSIGQVELSLDLGMTWSTDLVFQNLGAGDYTIVGRRAAFPDCEDMLSVTLLEQPCPCDDYSLSYVSTDVDCNNDYGSIEVLLPIGDVILWEDNSSEAFRENLLSGWYYLTITYEEGDCSHSDSIFIAEQEGLSFGLEVFPSDCEDSDDGSVEVVDVRGGNGDYMYSIDSINYQSESGFYDLAPLEYIALVTDSEGCLSFEEFLIEIANLPIDPLLDNEIQIQAGDSIYLNPLIDENSITGFSWTIEGEEIDGADLVLGVAPLVTTEYALTISYGDDCVEIRSVLIEVIRETETKDQDIFIPNTISSDDPSNAVFFPSSSADFVGRVKTLIIYDRWGNIIFENIDFEFNQPNQGWLPSNSDIISGVYVYYLEYENKKGAQRKAGTITLIR